MIINAPKAPTAGNEACDITPPLLGSLGAGGLADEFAKRFGTRWIKTPVKGTWAVWSDNVQFTCRWFTDGRLDIGIYQYPTPKDFKKAFEANQLEEAIFFQWEANKPFKHPYLAMREKLSQIGWLVN